MNIYALASHLLQATRLYDEANSKTGKNRPEAQTAPPFDGIYCG
jgi:hypothetical protein